MAKIEPVESVVKIGDTEPAQESESESVPAPVPCAVREDEEQFYRGVRENEMKDNLAIRVMNLVNDTHTETLKELAVKHLVKRFS